LLTPYFAVSVSTNCRSRVKLRKEGTKYNYSIDREFLKRVNESFGEYLDYCKVECGKRTSAAC
jgi:hypothetical protein